MLGSIMATNASVEHAISALKGIFGEQSDVVSSDEIFYQGFLDCARTLQKH